MVCFRLDEEQRRKLKVLTADSGTTIQDVMAEFALKWIEKMEKRVPATR